MKRRAAVACAACVVAYVIVLLNWKFPVLRCEPRWLNPPALLASFTLPWIALLFGWRAVRGWAQRLAIVATLSPLLLSSVIFGAFVFSEASTAIRERNDDAYERIAETRVRFGTLALYRTSGGATTPFWIEVRHELRLVPGLVLVRELPGFRPAYEAKIVAVSGSRVKVIASESSPPSREYELKRFVYF